MPSQRQHLEMQFASTHVSDDQVRTHTHTHTRTCWSLVCTSRPQTHACLCVPVCTYPCAHMCVCGTPTPHAQVLADYPATLRRKALRHLYSDTLRGCPLFRGGRARFLDQILMSCRSELFMPNVSVTHTRTRTHTRTHTHTHTHTHAYTQTHQPVSLLKDARIIIVKRS